MVRFVCPDVEVRIAGGGGQTARQAEEPRTDLVAVRRRGAGTDLAPNA
jgi:biotin synthase